MNILTDLPILYFYVSCICRQPYIHTYEHETTCQLGLHWMCQQEVRSTFLKHPPCSYHLLLFFITVVSHLSNEDSQIKNWVVHLQGMQYMFQRIMLTVHKQLDDRASSDPDRLRIDPEFISPGAADKIPIQRKDIIYR